LLVDATQAARLQLTIAHRWKFRNVPDELDLVEHVGGVVPASPIEVLEARLDGPYGFPLHGVLLLHLNPALAAHPLPTSASNDLPITDRSNRVFPIPKDVVT
jgi:hypothetical protein